MAKIYNNGQIMTEYISVRLIKDFVDIDTDKELFRILTAYGTYFPNPGTYLKRDQLSPDAQKLLDAHIFINLSEMNDFGGV